MKLRGGYLPKIAGRPSNVVHDAPVPRQLFIELKQFGALFAPAVGEGENVAFGSPLAWSESPGGRAALPAPASGTVSFEPEREGRPGRCVLNVNDENVRPVGPPSSPEHTSGEAIRKLLAEGGVWPLIGSSKTGTMPVCDGSETPDRIIVNFVAVEPFRTRGKVILENRWKRVITGLRFLPRLLPERGLIHLVLTEPSDPVALAIRKETAGYAWVRFENAPLRYPVEHPRVLCAALRRNGARVKPGEILWTLDAQAVEAVGACLGEGLPLHERILAVGGPGASNPRHVCARVGTRLESFMEPDDIGEPRLLLRGGLFQGSPVETLEAVRFDDDALFVLLRPSKREFLGFMNPGFDRVSFLPVFASRLTGAADSHVSATLRGERRPCIACGLCESVCPMRLLPQVLHRYLYRDALDEAERTGLTLCIACGLCAYVCPSKIELVREFAEAQERLRLEHEQAAAEQARQG